jgi:membrane dipeptidase
MPTIDRRTLLRSATVAAGTLAGAPYLNRGRYRLFAGSSTDYSARAVRLVRENLVIDALAPLTMSGETQTRWNTTGFTNQDFATFRESEIDVFHVANGVVGFENALTFIGRTNGFIASHTDYFMRIGTVRDLDRVHGSGKVGVLIGIQNSSHFRSPSDVDLFHGLGQRISQLTYNSRNLIGNGSTERVDGGISDFGVSIIERMNAVGMAVDVSHCGDQTTLQAFEISKKPVLITHSNARVLAGGHPRAKTDEAIRAVKRSGGVFGVTGVRMFVKPDEPTTVEHMLDHYDHVKKLVGSEHVAVGSDIDLDGYDDMPAEDNRRLRATLKDYAFREKIDIDEVAHPKRMYDLTEGLIRRKYSDAEIKAILGGNVRRALADIWDVPPPPPLTGRRTGAEG